MPRHRKLGRTTAQRKAILRGLVTSLIQYGRIETTETRAKEVKKIAERLITMAVRESDNFESKQMRVSSAVLDSKGNKMTTKKESKNGNSYEVVDREEKMDLRQVDSPSRLHVRRQIISWLYRVKDEEGKSLDLAGKLLNEIGPKYKERQGGYTRIYKLGSRRGDAAEIAVLELV